MAKAAPHTRWFSGWRSPPTAPDTDPADLGTAFGLELSLDDTPREPTPPMPAARRPGWMSRLAARRKPAT